MITRQFILAGKAIFTVSNDKGDRYTFRVTHKEGSDRFPPAWFLSMLTGPDNESDYSYISMIDAEMGTVRLTGKSKLTKDSLPLKVSEFGLRIIWGKQALPEGYAIHHEGFCGRCGKLLTVPSSVDSRFGPECIKKMTCKAV